MPIGRMTISDGMNKSHSSKMPPQYQAKICYKESARNRSICNRFAVPLKGMILPCTDSQDTKSCRIGLVCPKLIAGEKIVSPGRRFILNFTTPDIGHTDIKKRREMIPCLVFLEKPPQFSKRRQPPAPSAGQQTAYPAASFLPAHVPVRSR